MKKLLLVIIIFYSALSFADVYESSLHIKALVKEFVESRLRIAPDERLRIKIGHLGKRLKLPKCEDDLDVFIPPGYQSTALRTVGVRCESDQPWSLYVPVDVAIFSKVITAARILPRQTIITANDLSLTEVDRMRLLKGYYQRKSEVIGKITRQHVGMGMPLTPQELQSPLAVKRGQRVLILAQSGGMKVEMKGEAITQGGVGELIRVRNTQSRRVVQAMVMSPSLVQVNL